MARRIKDILIVLLVLSVIAVPLFYAYVMTVGLQALDDFARIWETADSVRMYVYQHEQWPKEWDDLAPCFDDLNGDLAYTKERVLLDFNVTVGEPQHGYGGYIRLKNGHTGGDIVEANKRVRELLERIRQKQLAKELPDENEEPTTD